MSYSLPDIPGSYTGISGTLYVKSHSSIPNLRFVRYILDEASCTNHLLFNSDMPVRYIVSQIITKNANQNRRHFVKLVIYSGSVQNFDSV